MVGATTSCPACLAAPQLCRLKLGLKQVSNPRGRRDLWKLGPSLWEGLEPSFRGLDE